MPTLNFTRFSGAVPRYASYSPEQTDGILYLVPESLSVRHYDPFRDVDSLMQDVVQTGAKIAANDSFMDHCLSHKMLPLRDVEFWQQGDFFTVQPDDAQPILDVLLDFARKYGLPMWEPVTTTYPARYAQRCMETYQDADDDLTYMVRYEAARRACRPTGAIPACTLALTLLDFYLRFVESIDGKQFFIRSAEWTMGYGHEKTPELHARVFDLTTCINLAYVQFSAGEGKAIRQCKNCGKFFISTDWRSEYCSPNCRGAYNSKMTRKRVKERKRQEKQ